MSTGEPVKASFENFEKLLMELSANIQRKERKLLQFYKKFDEFNRFLYRVFTVGKYEIVVIGCICGVLEKMTENKKSLKLLKEVQLMECSSKNMGFEQFFLEKELEKLLGEIKDFSVFFEEFEEILEEFKSFMQNKEVFKEKTEEIIGKEIENNEGNDEKVLETDYLYVKRRKFKKNEREMPEILHNLREMNISFLKIKTLKTQLKRRVFSKKTLEKAQKLLAFLEKFITINALKPEEILIKARKIWSLKQEKNTMFPALMPRKSLDFIGKTNKNPLNISKISSQIPLKISEEIHWKKEENPGVKRDFSLEEARGRAQARMGVQNKVLWSRNHKKILEKVGKSVSFLEKNPISNRDFVNNSFISKFFID